MTKSRYLYYYKHLACDTLILSRTVHTPMELPFLKGLVCVASSSTATSTLLTKGALELTLGQRATTTLAKKSIAAFNLREKSVVSCMVTLRGDQLYSFLDLLVTFIMPKWDLNAEERKIGRNKSTFASIETKQTKGQIGHSQSRSKGPGDHKSTICNQPLANTISFGLSNFLEFPQLEPFFPQFESAKGCNINIMIDPKTIRVSPYGFTQIWGF